MSPARRLQAAEAGRPRTSSPALDSISGKNLLTVQRVAEWLNVTRDHIYRLIDRGDLPAYRFGHAIRIAEEDVLAMLKPVESARSADAAPSGARRLTPVPAWSDLDVDLGDGPRRRESGGESA